MKPVKILIIDDEPVIRKGCAVTLADGNHAVDACATGKAGMEAIKKGEYDVLLLDMKLPDMEGMDILKKIRKSNPGIYPIVMTGYSTVQNAVEAMKSGAFDYLTKPFTDDELLFVVTIIHHLILCRPDFPFFNAVCLGWLQCFPSKEVLSFKFLHEYFTPAVSYG